MPEISKTPNYPETEENSQPIVLETDQPGLRLVQMTTLEDDNEYLQFQNQNLAHIAEFGNTIDATLEEVTKRRTEKNRVRFGIRKDGILVGMEGYTPSEDGTEAETGILLGKDAVGHGYATSALKAMSNYAANKFVRVFAEADPNNEKSLAMCERAGYVRLDGEVERDWGRAIVLDFRQ